MTQSFIGSKTRTKILTLFVLNPKREYYTREIEREIKANFEATRKSLIGLEKTGLLKSRVSGKQRYYAINTQNAIFPEIKSMILKTAGLGDILKNTFKSFNNIKAAFIYGSYARNTEDAESDIDMFIIGDVSTKSLQPVISGIENKFQREINPAVYPLKEFKDKLKTKHHFILSVLKTPKIFIKGSEDVVRELVQDK
jgi:predicted nucleotidyltransferase